MPEPTLRAVGSEAEEDLPIISRGRNIIAVIGIDKYEHWRTLHNAVSDAEGIRSLFVQRLGFKELVAPLVDGDATKPAIESFVQDELKPQLEGDDSLVVFFAGHGHTEIDEVGGRPVKTGYLVPVEGRLPEERKFSSYIDLYSLLRDLARLPARHVLVILDACYSGFALGDDIEIERSHERYEESLTRRVSRRVITSAMNDERALDSGPILDHSLFTGVVIKALDTGAPDVESKGFVTSSELGVHVQKAVANWPKSKQTPDFGAFELDDRGELVIPLRGETYNRLRAQECLEAGDCVYELGWIAGDAGRFRSAERQYREALKFANLAKIPLPCAESGLGKALLASQRPAQAAKVLAELLHREGDEAPVETGLYLGMAHAKAGDYQTAAKALETWQTKQPGHPDSAWVEEYVAWMTEVAKPSAGSRRALLIGIDLYQLPMPNLEEMKGAVNDVKMLTKSALIRTGNYDEANVTVLTDGEATREAVVAAFRDLQGLKQVADSVFVHYSGHAVPSSTPEIFGRNDVENLYLVLHDTHAGPGYLTNGITANELHRFMQQIPARRKTLVLDTHGSEHFLELSRREGNYALILASDTAEICHEWKVTVDEQEIPCGMLTGALYQSLQEADAETLTYDDWFTPTLRIVHEASSDTSKYHRRQTPYFDGIGQQRVFGRDDVHLPLFEFSMRQLWPELTVDDLTKLYALTRHQMSAAHPRTHRAFGQAFLSKKAYGQARHALLTAAEQDAEDPSTRLALLRAEFASGQHEGALASLQRYTDLSPETDRSRVDELLGLLKALANSHRRALLIGIDQYESERIPPLRGAANDVAAMRDLLIRRCGFRLDEIVELIDEQATRQRILQEFERLAERSCQSPGLFYYAGRGSHNHDFVLTILSCDGRQGDVYDISLDELAELAGADAKQLTTIMDTSFSGDQAGGSEELRTIEPDPRTAAAPKRFASMEEAASHFQSTRLGAVSILASP